MAKTPTTQAVKKVPITSDAILAALKGMSQAEVTAIVTGLKASGVSVKADKVAKEKVFVAQRLQLKDTAPEAKHPRKAGEVTMLTENALLATLTTWVRGKDSTVKIPLMMASIKAGHTEDFSNFRLTGIVKA